MSSPLNEALAWFAETIHADDDTSPFQDTKLAAVLAAARRWADLEAQVADGARVVVERPCSYCRNSNTVWQVWHCQQTQRRVVLGVSDE